MMTKKWKLMMTTPAMLLAFVILNLVHLPLVSEAHTLEPDQPFMEAALSDLGKAKKALQQAEANKGGHRAKALDYIEQAITEVNAGIDYARQHGSRRDVEELRPSGAAWSVKASFDPDQPHMQDALGYLQSARDNLQQAKADKGGHRGKALGLISNAISEVKNGIRFAA